MTDCRERFTEVESCQLTVVQQGSCIVWPNFGTIIMGRIASNEELFSHVVGWLV